MAARGQNFRRVVDCTGIGACAVLRLLGVVLAILLSPTSAVFAQQGPAVVLAQPKLIPVVPADGIRFRRVSLEQGLSQTRVAQIIQDDEGFIWFGTQHGVNRFDGNSFKVYKHDLDRPDSLSGVFIYALFNDRSGRVWVGTDQGLDAFEKTTETFRHYRLDDSNPFVIHISQDVEGMLWLATGQGLYRLNPDTGEVKRFGSNPADPSTLSSDDIKSTGEDREGNFWVATSQGLEAFDRQTGRVTQRIPLRVEVREFSFHEDRFGVFWIIYGSGNGLATYDRKTNTLTRLSFTGSQIADSGLTGVFALIESRDGTIYLGTMGAGLLKFDRENNRFLSYGHNAEDPDSLSENRVIALFEDSEGNVWTGLHATPPNSFPSVAPMFESIRPIAADSAAEGERLVNAIFSDSAGRVWMGAGGALLKIDRSTRKTERVEPLGAGVPVEVLAIAEDKDGMIWVGTLGTGLHRIDPRTNTVISYRNVPTDAGSINSDVVTRILFDRSGQMWVTTWNGLARFDNGSGRFIRFKRDPASSAEPYFSIVEDASGAFWLGSTTGLYRFDPQSSEFRSFRHDSNDSRSISNNTINCVLIDREGMVWAGTQNGLNVLDPADGKVKSYFQADGLPGGVVSCLLADDAGDLWISTNNGVAQRDRTTGAFSSFSTADGLPGNDLTGWNACYRGRDGEMFFGGFAGATAVHPDKKASADYTQPIVLTELSVSGAVVDPLTPPLSESVTYTKELVLQPSVTEFSVAFSALSFTSPATTRYRYRLVGFDAGWNEGRRRSVAYTGLPHGRYRLEVQAATLRGAWSEPGATLDVVILPPWWATWWFRIACVAAFALLLYAAYRYRFQQIARQYEIRLQERVNERTRIARELHDSLLQGFHGILFRLQAVRDLLPGKPNEAAENLEIAMERADQALIEGRDAVQELRSAPLVHTDLAQALAALSDELMTEEQRGKVTLDILVEGRSRVLDTLIRDELYRLAREALRNAFQHANASKVECEIFYSDSILRLRVRDDGRGIDEEVLEKGLRAGHWGLPGMRERAERLGGTFSVWSARNKGTEIEVRIPGKLAYGLRDPGSSWLGASR